MADAFFLNENDGPIDASNKLKQGINYSTLNALTLTVIPSDNENYYALNRHIYDLETEGLNAIELNNYM